MGNMLEISASNEAVPAYLAEPTGDVKGGIIVIHEIWALNDHTKSIADRFAAEGYLALAPNLLTVLDITEHAAQLQADLFNPEKRNEAQPKIRAMMAPIQEPGFAEKTITNVKACFDFLYDKPETKQRVAVNGYCFGGSYSYSLAINEPRLKAAIPFYGHVSTDVDELKKITCPILAFYGEKDEGLMGSLPEVKEAMKTAGVNYEAVVYPNCGHAFFNDTNPYAYNKEAADSAWQRTLAFLAEYLV